MKSTSKVKTTAKITSARYNLMKYIPIYTAVTADDNIFTMNKTWPRNKYLKKYTPYFCKPQEKVIPRSGRSQYLPFLCYRQMMGREEKERQKTSSEQMSLSTYTVERKEWSGRAQTQANDSLSLHFSWTCLLN